MEECREEKIINRIERAAENHCSPCDVCEMNGICLQMCGAWKRYFSHRWRAIQEMFGKN